MPSRLNWSPQEDQLLKYLRSELGLSSWMEIAQKLRATCPQEQRSAKQCRERFANFAQFGGNAEENSAWTEEEDQLLFELYLAHGPRWTLFVPHFSPQNRSQNSIKNRFYSCLRKTSRKLIDAEKQANLNGKRSIKYELIMNILEVASVADTQSQILFRVKLDSENSLLKLRQDILKMSFTPFSMSQPEVRTTVHILSQMNTHLRCLGFFKTKKNGQWELTQKRLAYISNLSNQTKTTLQCSSSTLDFELASILQQKQSQSFTSTESQNQKSDFQYKQFQLTFPEPIENVSYFLELLRPDNSLNPWIEFQY